MKILPDFCFSFAKTAIRLALLSSFSLLGLNLGIIEKCGEAPSSAVALKQELSCDYHGSE